MLHLLLLSAILILTTASDQEDSSECTRLHKAWHLTTDEEKQLYISALHQLNDQGKLARFSTTHHYITDSEQAHFTAAFFAWHRYFIWEFENQVRELGGEYECFAVPYWDITHDAGEEGSSYIFRSGVGGAGDIDADLCIDKTANGAWNRDNYPLIHACHSEEDLEDNIENGCCLKRGGPSKSSSLSSTSSYVHFIKTFKNFGPAHGFRQATFMKYHGEAHGYIGGSLQDYTQMISRYSPEDPAFFMLHTWLDYMFEVWKNCWGYNHIDAQELGDYLMAYDPYPINSEGMPNSELDTTLKYSPMNDMKWWMGETVNPTPRKMWNPRDWDFQFEQGTFIYNSHLTELCDNAWDTEVLTENSEMTKSIIDDHREDETDVEKYEIEAWEYLESQMKNYHLTINDDDDPYPYLQTWAAKTCNYQRQSLGKEPCYIPQEYGTCTLADKDRHNEITIEELLEKEGVKGNECLEEIRISLYGYAKSMNMLWELCMGEFDEYHICQMPLIDFMIDRDDKAYYFTMEAVKARMEKEAAEAKQAQKVEDEEKERGEEEKIVVAAHDEIVDNVSDGTGGDAGFYSYPGFENMVYCVVGAIIAGLVFLICVKKCFDKKKADIDDYEIDGVKKMKNKSFSRSKMYGSFYQMV